MFLGVERLTEGVELARARSVARANFNPEVRRQVFDRQLASRDIITMPTAVPAPTEILFPFTSECRKSNSNPQK